MSDVLQRENPRKAALHIWKMMSLGPLTFLFWLLAIVLFLLYVSYFPGTNEPPAATDDLPPGGDVAGLLIWLAPLSVMVCEIVGVRAAYIRRDMLADTPFASHAISAIRTFNVMFWGFGATILLSLMLLAIPNMNAVGAGVGMMFIMMATVPLLFIWNGFRVVRGWRRASEGKPVSDRPTRWT
jgi:uncharacterized membrane protein